jgi:hypothetical protein
LHHLKKWLILIPPLEEITVRVDAYAKHRRAAPNSSYAAELSSAPV